MQPADIKSRIVMDRTYHLLTFVAVFLLFTSGLRAQSAQAGTEEEKLIKVLSSDATLFDKAKACQRLAVIGGKDAVPALAKLLANEKLAHYARFGLEPNPDPSVDIALREAMANLEGSLRIGVINSIGARRDAGALDALTELLGAPDEGVATAAAAAVGRIGTPRAATALRKALADSTSAVRTSIAAACLPCAETLLAAGKRQAAVRCYRTARRAKNVPQHVKLAALRGLLLARGANGLPQLVKTLKGKGQPAFNTALIAAREVPGTNVTEALVETLAELSPRRQAMLIGVLGERGDRAALPAVLEAAKSEAAEVRVAAVGTLRSLGDASAVPVLLEVATQTDGETARMAQLTLASLPGKAVDDALLARLVHGETEQRPAVLEAVGQRRIRSAVPTLRKTALESHGKIRIAAIGALGRTVSLEEIPILTAELGKAGTPEERAAILDALKSAAGRMPDRDACAKVLVRAMSGASADEKALLLDVFVAVGGPEALATVTSSAKDSNETIRSAATKALGEWTSEEASHALLDLLKTSSDGPDRMRTLRAFSDLVRRLGFPKEERLGVCNQAMELAKTDEERRVVIHTYAGIPAPETLDLLRPYLSDPGLREDAALACVTICERIVRSRRSATARAMKDVLEATKSQETAKRAKSLLEQAGGRR